MKTFLLAGWLILFAPTAFAQNALLSPAEFLGYKLGEHFTPHHRVVDYFNHVSTTTANAEIRSYGKTYEQRPLFFLVITSAENFRRLEQIRTQHLANTEPEESTATATDIAIVWLSYNVHGNESSAMEAAMKTAYALANPENEEVRQWLTNTVVIIDPCLNPDGRDRYANFFYQYGNRPANPHVDAFEHHEPWPGGRTNHYFFDLNRDWAWATQIESQQRLKLYNQWLPHIHVDFHEQSHNNPYFFAPAAEPMHAVISDWQREFQDIVGKNNARHFDERGWLYFTKEVFDLYYPSYGDTYPTYSGAIGMTYEQAGGGASGLKITTQTGDPLTLEERIIHHYTAGLSTIETASQNAARLSQEFKKYFSENNQNPASRFKTYLLKAGNGTDKLKRMAAWLDLHGILYGHPSAAKNIRGFDYRTRSHTSVNISEDDLVIDVHQPKSRFITTVFEPSSVLSDSLTYDITAWNLVYAQDLEAFALTERVPASSPYNASVKKNNTPAANPYAYVFRYQDLEDVRFLGALLQAGLRVRAAERAFTINGENFAPGSLIVTRQNNENVPDLNTLVTSLADMYERRLFTAVSGFVDHGGDLGSNNLHFLNAPKVAMLFGGETSPLSAGEVWHFFEQQIRYPITQLGTTYFKNVNLGHYDVLIVPEGSYTLFDDALLEKISSWVSEGGRLVLISNALNSFVDKKGFALTRYSSEVEKAKAEEVRKVRFSNNGFPRFEEAERTQLSHSISGAIYQAKLDNSHPLAFGMRDTYFTLKTHGRRFAHLAGGWNVAWFGNDVRPIQGFAGFRANDGLKDSLLLGLEQKGEGEIVYFVDNPLFRSFWQSGKMLFSNAIFMADH